METLRLENVCKTYKAKKEKSRMSKQLKTLV